MKMAETLIHEMDQINIPRLREKPIRSLSKAISWRITGSLDTVLLAWLFTRSVDTALAIGLTEVLTKTLLYYWHERAWSKISLGVH